MNQYRLLSVVPVALAAYAAALALPLWESSGPPAAPSPPPPPAASSTVAVPPQPSSSVPLVWGRCPADGASSVLKVGPSERLASFEVTREVIVRAQQELLRLGYDAGAPDGVVGPKTRGAIRSFQQSKGLEPDGMLTPDLVQMLGAAH